MAWNSTTWPVTPASFATARRSAMRPTTSLAARRAAATRYNNVTLKGRADSAGVQVKVLLMALSPWGRLLLVARRPGCRFLLCRVRKQKRPGVVNHGPLASPESNVNRWGAGRPGGKLLA